MTLLIPNHTKSNKKQKKAARKGNGAKTFWRDHHRHHHHRGRHHQNAVLTRIVPGKSLGPSLPKLVITYTNDQESVKKWLRKHVGEPEKKQFKVQCVGMDTETKPNFVKGAASRGPDTLQLAVADGHCLVFHLSRASPLRGLVHSKDGLHLRNSEDPFLGGHISLCQILHDTNIAKAGVSIDNDALELFEHHWYGTNCRVDLAKLAAEDDVERKAASEPGQRRDTEDAGGGNTVPSIPRSLKGLAEYYVTGLNLPKKKRLQMSDWSASYLSDEQVEYAAADAFAAAAVMSTLNASSSEHHRTYKSMIDRVITDEVDITQYRVYREERKRERKQEAEKRRVKRKQEEQSNSGRNKKWQKKDKHRNRKK